MANIKNKTSLEKSFEIIWTKPIIVDSNQQVEKSSLFIGAFEHKGPIVPLVNVYSPIVTKSSSS